MAIDTRDKRASATAATLLWLVVAPTPDASLAAEADRRQIVGLYRGVVSEPAAGLQTRAVRVGGLRVAPGADVRLSAGGGVRLLRRPAP